MKKHIAISMIYRFAEKHGLRTDEYETSNGIKFLTNKQGKSIIGFTNKDIWGFSRKLSLFKEGNQIEPTNGLSYWCCTNHNCAWYSLTRQELEKFLEKEFENTNKFFYFMKDNYLALAKEYKEKQMASKIKSMMKDFDEAK